jgi:hypothetical protein
MKSLIFFISMVIAVSALTSTTKIKDGFDTVYGYQQKVTVYIDEKVQSESVNRLEVLIRPGAEPNTIIGRLKNLGDVPENATAEEIRLLKDIESPFKLDLSPDGTLLKIIGKKGEDRYSLKTKDSILGLLLQNVTQIEQYLNRVEARISNEDCKTFTRVEKNLKEIVFEVETKIRDCNNKTSLDGLVSDMSEFKVFYHLDKDDKKLTKAKSVIDITYLTSVAARFQTVLDLEYIRDDGLKEDIDLSVFVDHHTTSEIDELWKTPTTQ